MPHAMKSQNRHGRPRGSRKKQSLTVEPLQRPKAKSAVSPRIFPIVFDDRALKNGVSDLVGRVYIEGGEAVPKGR